MKQTEADLIESMYAHYHYRCFVCGKPATQRAHIIGRTKANYKRYGKAVVDNPLNWLPACDLDCNALIDAGGNLNLKEKISYIVRTTPPEDWHYSLIEREVRKNIKRKKEKLYRIDNV